MLENSFKWKLKRRLLRGAAISTGLILSSLLVFFGWRKFAQSQVVNATAITEHKGISSLEKFTLGGLEQWVLIRGHQRDAQILLFLHGGPGLPNMPLCHLQADLEKHFVVVQWDQRGAGKSFSDSIAPDSMTIDRFVEDTAELTHQLRERFQRDRIILLGHSWGSIVGLKTVDRYPNLFHSYIGVSQVTNATAAQRLVYEQILEKARARGISKAVSELDRIGPPPFASPQDHLAACRWLAKLEDRPKLMKARLAKEALRSPYYTIGDYVKLLKGASFTLEQLWDPLTEVDLSTEIPSLQVPGLFIQGRDDSLIPGELIENYVKALDAPQGKRLVWIENADHLPHLTKPKAFVDAVMQLAKEKPEK